MVNKINSDEIVMNGEKGIDRILEIMRRLRDPKTGCPWDIEQDFASIAPYTIEEAYEVADAIERADMDELQGELGDLLLQVIYHSQMAAEENIFDFDRVAHQISDKMIKRHPHVFGDESRDKTAEDQIKDWEKIKAAERAGKERKGVLDDVALGLPALTRAIKLQNRAARVGFDWPSTDNVIDKLIEEAQELKEAVSELSAKEQHEEFGDLLFVMVNLARHLKIDPEEALRATNLKFTRRFKGIEAELKNIGKTVEDSNLEEMDALWNKVKAQERKG